MPAAIHLLRALLASALATLLAAVVVPVAAEAANAEAMSFDHAVRALRAERNVPEAVAALERYARQGHGHSRLLLGTLLLEGKQVPRDAPLGLAFVRLGSQTSDLAFNLSVRQKIDNLVLLHASSMSGPELIVSDRLVGVILEDENRYLLEELGDSLATIVGAMPIALVPDIRFGQAAVRLPPAAAGDNGPFVRRGCAAASEPTCPPAEPVNGSASCTGEIGPIDVTPFANRRVKHLVMPTYPMTARRDGIEGTITVAAHVDSSGLLCSASVVGTPHSSMRSLAGAALEAMARWRLEPARRGGKPVESVRLLAVHFRLTN